MKKRIRTRIGSIILAAAMLLSLLPVTALAVDEKNYVTLELTYGDNVSDDAEAAARQVYEDVKYDTCKAANEAYMALFGVTWVNGILNITDTNAPLYPYRDVSGSVTEATFKIHGTLAGFTSRITS